MLVLTRGPGDKIDITLEDGRRITVMICSNIGGKARVGVDAPHTIKIDRHEVTERIWAESHPRVVNGNV